MRRVFIKKTENGYVLKDERTAFEIDRSTALALAENIDYEYYEQDVRQQIDEKYGEGTARKLSGELVDEIVEEYAKMRSESEEWHGLCNAAIERHQEEINKANASESTDDGAKEPPSTIKWIVEYDHHDGRNGTVQVTTEVSKSDAFCYGNGKCGALIIGGYPTVYDLRYNTEKDLHMAMIKSYFGEGLVKVDRNGTEI